MTDRKQAMIALRDKVKAGEPVGRSAWLALDDGGRGAFKAYLACRGSLNDAHALHKAMLGDGYISTGWKYCIWGHGMASVWNVITGDSAVGKIDSRELHSVCAARAWLIAILEALIAEADQ